MSVIRSLSRLVVVCAVLSPLAQSQVASSANYQLSDFVFDGGGGGMASPGYGGWIAVGEVSRGRLVSTNYRAGVGFLETSDPIPGNSPVIFGLTPDLGVNAGGTPVTVSGWNFNKFGVGPSVTMSLDGNFATGLNVTTNTQLTATTAAGDPGPAGVVVTSSLGSDSDPDGWIYTPAVVSTAFTQPGGEMDLKNYGTSGNAFITMAAANPGFANTSYGPFLLDPNFIFVMYGVPYPASGVHKLHATVPNNPALIGFTIHIQSLEAVSFGPIVGQLTNATTVTFQ